MIQMKALMVALTAALAVFGATAEVASAAEQGMFTTDGAGATLDMTETGAGNGYTILGYIFSCSGSTFHGHEVGSFTRPVPNKATTFTFSGEFSGCHFHIGTSELPATAFTNGCDYQWHVGLTTGSANTYGGSTDIVCPAEKSIELVAYAGSSHLIKLCTVKIGGQSGLSGFHFTSTSASDDVDINGTLENLAASASGTGCATEETKAGRFDIDMTVQGTNASKESTGITISD